MSTNDSANAPEDHTPTSDTADFEGEILGAENPSGVQEYSGGSWLRRQLWVMGFRRQLLVNPSTQIRSAILTTLPFAALLVFINILIHLLRSREAALISESAPEFGRVIEQTGRSEMLLVILASLVVLVGVFIVSIIETHRTAGAAFNIGRKMRRITQGRLDSRLSLRKGDNLTELVEPFNEMAEALETRARDEAERMKEMARAVESGLDKNSAVRVAAELNGLATEKRRSVEPPVSARMSKISARDLQRDLGFTLVEVLVVVAIIGLVGLLALQLVLSALDRDRVAKTMINIRDVSWAVSQHLDEAEGELPDGFYKVLQIADDLEDFVQPVPFRDAWGHYLWIERLETETGDEDEDPDDLPSERTTYRIYSFGKDGVPDSDVVTGIWIDYDSDIVMQNRTFIRVRWW
jgi:prepilin-type N-terminal cleavage/methylation domain-containing protein